MGRRLGRRILCLSLSALIISTMLVGCTTSNGEAGASGNEVVNTTENIEVNQNDYRGAVMRTEAIKGNIMNIVNEFNGRNSAIVTENPSSYWDSDAYKYLSLNFLNSDIAQQTIFFNETETDWATVDSATRGLFSDEEGNMLVSEYLLVREMENQYNLSYKQSGLYAWFQNRTATFVNNISVLYDANHDWARATRTRKEIYGTSPLVNDGIFEYARLGNNSFAIQTETERLYVVYEDTLYDEANASELLTNPLANKEIVYFAYSRLNGEILPQYYAVDFDENTGEYIIHFGNEVNNSIDVDTDGNYVRQYNPCDSMFLNIESVGTDWVLEQNGLFSQVLIYENGNLTVKTLNELSEQLEYTIFHADGTTESGIEIPVSVEDIILEDLVTDEEIPEEAEGSAFDYESPTSNLYALNCLVVDREWVNIEGTIDEPFSLSGNGISVDDLANELSSLETATAWSSETDLSYDGVLVSMNDSVVTMAVLNPNSVSATEIDTEVELLIGNIALNDNRADIDDMFGTTTISNKVVYSEGDTQVYVDYNENNKVEYVAIFIP